MAFQELKEEQKIRKEYEQSPEFIENYKPIQNQWTSMDFHIVQEGEDLADQFALNMGKFDLYEEHFLHKIYTSIMQKDESEYETTLIIFYNPVKKIATYFVGYDEQFSQENIEKLNNENSNPPIIEDIWLNFKESFKSKYIK